VSVQKRSHKAEKLARIYDDEIAPVWGTRFGRMLLRDLEIPERGQILDVSCGTGYPTVELLRRMGDGSRLIAIDASSAMLDVARRKVQELGPLGKKGIFFRTESPIPKLSFANDVYDLVVCNLGLSEMPDAGAALRDFARVTKRGGEVRCTLPVAGSYQEFYDIFREVLVKHDRAEALARLDDHLAAYPTPEQCEDLMQRARLEPKVELEEFSLVFRSSREFFFAPVIEYGVLSEWKALVGTGQEMQDIFWHIKEAIDAYYAERAFVVTIKAACLVGKKLSAPLAMSRELIIVDDDGEPLPAPPAQVADGSSPSESSAAREIELGTGDYEIPNLPELPDTEEALDAFTEGKPRPLHLDD
jgi:ubiquinone/menaquinone biosynthesis C-methylase UbiE